MFSAQSPAQSEQKSELTLWTNAGALCWLQRFSDDCFQPEAVIGFCCGLAGQRDEAAFRRFYVKDCLGSQPWLR